MARKERAFSEEVLDAVKALRPRAWEFCFDNAGDSTSGARRPADRLVVYRGRPFLLELKQVSGGTLAHSKIEPHQVRALLRCQEAGGFGLVLVRRPGARAWMLSAATLLLHDPDSRGVFPRGAFDLEREGRPLQRIPDPRGFTGLVWALGPLFNSLLEEDSMPCNFLTTV